MYISNLKFGMYIIIKYFIVKYKKPINVPDAKAFIINTFNYINTNTKATEGFEDKAYKIFRNQQGHDIGSFLDIYATTNLYSSSFIQGIKDQVRKHVSVLNDRIDILLSLFKRDYSKFESIDIPTFPIILIVDESTNKISVYQETLQEFRATQPLKFDIDITIIATDTLEHKAYLENYFKSYNINMNIILFSQLK